MPPSETNATNMRPKLDKDMYTSLPVTYSKHQSAFGKFAAQQAALEESPYAAMAFAPPTPYTPSNNNVETASPEELFMNSTVGLDASPLFDSIDLTAESANWTSLFPDSETEKSSTADTQAISVKEEYSAEPTPMHSASASPDVESGDAAHAQGPSRKRQRRSTSSQKIDELGLTAYSRKPRLNPLKPVEVDGNDETAAKRAKNTEAARRSRARRVERMGQLEDRVGELMDINEKLEAEVARLKRLVGEE